MNFDFDEDQKFLGQEARRFLTARVPSSLVHDVLDDPANGEAARLWQEISAQGWPGIAIPEEYGGLGAGALELCVIAEELGRAIAPTPFLSSIYLFSQAMLMSGTHAQKQRYLPGIASGERRGCMAVREGAGTALRVQVGCVHGEYPAVIDGMEADHAIVLADDGNGDTLWVVGLAGVLREPVATIDPTRPLARFEFDGAPAEPLGERGQGRAILRDIYDRAAVPLAFEQLGGADRCLELARDFSLERHAFGRQIGSFQAVKHKLADMFIQNQLARSNCYFGAWAMNANAPELSRAAAAARLSAGQAFWLAAKEGLHVHGGMGFTWESDCQLFYRRAQHLALALGSDRAWSERLVDGLLKDRAAA